MREARREGYRSRSVYKLAEIAERDRLLKSGISVVDLGAAPGGWSQYIQRKFGARVRVVALDVLPMEPVPGVVFIQGDFREATVLAELERALEDKPLDLVLSDLSPNISGIDVADQIGSMYLTELALEFARLRLRPGGTLLVKAFQGEGFDDFLKNLRQVFEKVAIRKPKASRPRSRETYLLARGLRPC